MKSTVIPPHKNWLIYALQTPLHYAATVGDVSIITQLLAKGGDALKEDTEGWTPLQLAVDEGNIGVVIAMVEHGSREGALHWAALCGRDDVGKALLVCLF